MSLFTEKPIYPIAECPDLMVDACLWEGVYNLMFVSLWGRDTAIQAFIGRLSLGRSSDGLDHFHVVSGSNDRTPIYINSVDRLSKLTARTYLKTKFGSLTNLWLFDKRCIKPDKGSSSAVLLLRKDAVNAQERIWSTVKDTCPLPLLDNWQDQVLEVLNHNEMLSTLPQGIGNIAGYQINLDVDRLKVQLGEKIRQGLLTIDNNPVNIPVNSVDKLSNAA